MDTMLLYLYEIHKRGIEYMSSKDKGKKNIVKHESEEQERRKSNQLEEHAGDSNESTKKDNIIKKLFENQIFCGVVVELIVAAILVVLAQVKGILALPEDVASIKSDMINVGNDVADLKNQVDEMEDVIEELKIKSNDIDDIKDRIKWVENSVMNLFILYPTNIAIESINVEYETIKTDCYLSQPPVWNKKDIIAKDPTNGMEYSAEELAGKNLLLPYVQDGKEIYFYGQFDENNQWNGNCVINVYEENILQIITEAEYKNGEILNYKQVIPSTTHKGEDIWIIAEREKEGNSNSGENWNYIREKEYRKDFSIEEVTIGDIINVTEFKESLNTRLEGYYNGNTFDGLYNDSTGTAYLVKYSENGTVRTLYVGKMKNGYFDDASGKAWYITKDENTSYMYYKGIFKDGRPTNNVGSIFINNLTFTDIMDKLQGKEFDCNLTWDF